MKKISFATVTLLASLSLTCVVPASYAAVAKTDLSVQNLDSVALGALSMRNFYTHHQ